MADTKTIDEILRAKGRAKLEAELDGMLVNIRLFISDCPGWTSSGLFKKRHKTQDETKPLEVEEVNALDALGFIIKNILNSEAKRYEQAEVNAFLTKLDGVSQEVENLRNEVLG
jgi:hypothetical protein